MSATIHELATIRTRAMPAPTAEHRSELPDRFVFWRGVSGRSYVHTVYSLIGCPEIPSANVVLVRRASDGTRRALKICRVTDEAPSSNLAEIRHVGANLGANEVHVHLLASTPLEARRIELDLRGAEMREPSRANIPPGIRR